MTSTFADLNSASRSRPAAEMDALQHRTDVTPVQAREGATQPSPRQVAQLARWQGIFGPTAQLATKEEEELKAKVQRVAAQRKTPEEEEELVQGRFAGSPAGREGAAQRKAAGDGGENRTGLPDDLKSGVESLSGMALDDVRVHYHSAQPAQLNALAYAQGRDIYVAPGQEQYLPHEAWHVVQQAQGRVQPTMQMKEGVPVNDDAGLEREADAMSAQALRVGAQRRVRG